MFVKFVFIKIFLLSVTSFMADYFRTDVAFVIIKMLMYN